MVPLLLWVFRELTEGQEMIGHSVVEDRTSYTRRNRFRHGDSREVDTCVHVHGCSVSVCQCYATCIHAQPLTRVTEEILLGTSAIDPPGVFQREAHLGLTWYSHVDNFIIVVGTAPGR